MIVREFEEIAHSGGKVIFNVSTDYVGQRTYNVSFENANSFPVSVVFGYALCQGIPVKLLNYFEFNNSQPPPRSYIVIIVSDIKGEFGHSCPSCGGYWRAGAFVLFCPYCRLFSSESHVFLSKAQLAFIRHYCHKLNDALSSGDGVYEIDIDSIVDIARTECRQSRFCISEKSQQHKFRCMYCNGFNDILGRFGYCSCCGMRNDFVILEEFIKNIRKNMSDNVVNASDVARDAVTYFEGFIKRYAKELARLVPLAPRRKGRLTKKSFFNLRETCDLFSNWFDIDFSANLKKTPREFLSVELMFHRRHLYAHNGGEVDQKYLDDSKDSSVQLKQTLRETQESVHILLDSLVKMGKSLHDGFHLLFPPCEKAISDFKHQSKS